MFLKVHTDDTDFADCTRKKRRDLKIWRGLG
jgi:hypothetical protein